MSEWTQKGSFVIVIRLQKWLRVRITSEDGDKMEQYILRQADLAFYPKVKDIYCSLSYN